MLKDYNLMFIFSKYLLKSSFLYSQKEIALIRWGKNFVCNLFVLTVHVLPELGKNNDIG